MGNGRVAVNKIKTGAGVSLLTMIFKRTVTYYIRLILICQVKVGSKKQGVEYFLLFCHPEQSRRI